MRTTVTLDDHLAEALKDAAREDHVSFKEALNAAVRRGLARREREPDHYRLPTYPLGVRPGIDMDKANQLAAELEDEAIAAKLELRK